MSTLVAAEGVNIQARSMGFRSYCRLRGKTETAESKLKSHVLPCSSCGGGDFSDHVVTSFVVPQFEDIFKGFGAELSFYPNAYFTSVFHVFTIFLWAAIVISILFCTDSPKLTNGEVSGKRCSKFQIISNILRTKGPWHRFHHLSNDLCRRR